MKQTDNDDIAFILSPHFERVCKDRLRRRGCSGEFKEIGCRVAYEQDSSLFPGPDFDQNQHLKECEEITRAFSRIPQCLENDEIELFDMNTLLRRAKNWAAFPEPGEKPVMDVVVVSLEQALGVESVPLDPDFSNLPPFSREPGTQAIVRKMHLDTWGTVLTKRDLYLELKDMTYDFGVDRGEDWDGEELTEEVLNRSETSPGLVRHIEMGPVYGCTTSEESAQPSHAEESSPTEAPRATEVLMTTEESELKAQNVFHRNGDFWEIVFRGNTSPHIRHLDGLTYINVLLASPGKKITAMELYEREHPPSPEVVRPMVVGSLDRADDGFSGPKRSYHPILDPKARAELLQAAEDHKRQRDDTSATPETRAESEATLRRIEKALVIMPGGITFDEKGLKRARQAVSTAIDRAIAAIEGHSKSLAKHLNDGVCKGSTLAYNGRLDWDT